MSTPAKALSFGNHIPKRHDRFYVGANKAFIDYDAIPDNPSAGSVPLDFSGVGYTEVGQRFATMISPQYFVSASHWYPVASVDHYITFFEGNDTSHKHNYEIDPSWCQYRVGDSDLYVGKLKDPIPDADNIAFYPILSLESEADYLGREVYLYGYNGTAPSPPLLPNHGVGRNETRSFLDYGPTLGRQICWGYRDTVGLGDDEAHGVSGDSGGPAFMIWNNALALVGVFCSGATGTFIPHYLPNVASYPGGPGNQLTLWIEGDLNGDASVGADDLDVIRAHWGQTVLPGNLTLGDASSDGFVGADDLDVVRNHWGDAATMPLPAPSPAPEPSVWVSVCAGAIAVLLLRRKRRCRGEDQYRCTAG